VGNCRGGTPQPEVQESTFNFLTIDATSSSLDVTAIGVPQGSSIDHFTISS
jgi:hypothetical protein